MSDSESVGKQRKLFARVKQIEDNGGDTRCTRDVWPLSNHSCGDKRFPTCGMSQALRKRYGDEKARDIMTRKSSVGSSSAEVSSSSASADNTTSTPVPVFRARLVRPATWSTGSTSPIASRVLRSTGSTSSIARRAINFVKKRTNGVANKGNDSGVFFGASSTVQVDSSFRRNMMGRPSVIDLARMEPEESKKDDDDYNLSEIWDSEEEERKAEERQREKSAR